MSRRLREPIPRIDTNRALYQQLLPLARLAPGEVWEDPKEGHRVGVLDATDAEQVERLMQGQRAYAAIHDPPYNFAVGGQTSEGLSARSLSSYLDFTRRWVANSVDALADEGHLYVWMGADQRHGFQPVADVAVLMRDFPELESRSWITVRNQRGYGTQGNWMAVRQEILYYRRGVPEFTVQHTEIPRLLRGYYKDVRGRRRENSERSRSDTIRPGNVWMDIQQVFYRSLENVPGAYAQKPLSAIERLLASTAAASRAASGANALVIDFFAHSGTTLVAAERIGLPCYTMDRDPVFAELTIRRLEHYRRSGRPGWQCENPFPELD